MNNKDFWEDINQIIYDEFSPDGLKNLTTMPTSLFQDNVYLNDFHRKNSMAAQREVRLMSLHPYSREQKLQQISMMKRSRISKESANSQRNKLKG